MVSRAPLAQASRKGSLHVRTNVCSLDDQKNLIRISVFMSHGFGVSQRFSHQFLHRTISSHNTCGCRSTPPEQRKRHRAEAHRTLMLTLYRKDLKKLPKASSGTPQVLWTRPGTLCPSSCRHKAQYSLNRSAPAKKRANNRLAISQLVHHQQEEQLTVWPELAGVNPRLSCHARHAHIRPQFLPKRPSPAFAPQETY